MTTKIDLKRELDCYRAVRDDPRIITVPDLQYLMIDGLGDPNTAAFAEAITTLYPLAYSLKFACKTDLGRDYVVMPLEGLWWSEEMENFTNARDKTPWDWTLAIMTPDWITDDMFAAAVDRVAAKHNPARLGQVRLQTLPEGQCVQALHVGSFDDETELLHRMHDEYIPARGLAMSGKHHEIYLSDFRKVEPAKCKTILRQPVVAST